MLNKKKTNKTLKLLCYESFNVVDQCMITSTLCLVVKKMKGNNENLETHQKPQNINQ